MQDKRAAMKDGAPNPFVKPGEFATYVAGLEVDFDKATSGIGSRRGCNTVAFRRARRSGSGVMRCR